MLEALIKMSIKNDFGFIIVNNNTISTNVYVMHQMGIPLQKNGNSEGTQWHGFLLLVSFEAATH